MSTALSYADAYALTKSRTEAHVLRHISFWQDRAKAKRHGERWVVRTLEEFLQDDFIQVSTRTIKRALASLATKGLIEKFRSVHPFKSGIMTALWVRVTGGKKGQNGPTGGDKMSSPEGTKCPSPETGQGTGQGEVVHMAAGASGKKIGSLKGMTGADIKAKHKPKKPPAGKTLKPLDLFHLIRAIMADQYPDYPVGDPTGLALGQCKTILKRLRDDHGMEDAQIRSSLEDAYEAWPAFRDYVHKINGKTLHGVPTIAQTTTNVSFLVSFLKQQDSLKLDTSESLPANSTSADDLTFD